ncbi:MAG: hypothetical protein IKD18_04115 [Clostridia bacterium]|nr:hypothetical protein [Clostridia bacterium]
MTLMELGAKIGAKKMETMPKEMLSYYPVPEDRKGELCSMEMIERLQERFEFFGEFYDDVKERWAALEQDEDRKTWVDVCSLFMKDQEYEIVTKIPVPDPDGTLAGDLLLLFIHVPAVEKAYDAYIQRGFDEQSAREYMLRYVGNVRHTSNNIIGRTSLIAMYFRWLCLYTKARIFSYKGFNFEVHRVTTPYVLKNKKTGALLPVAKDQVCHRDGTVLGSAGYEDEEGSFTTSFVETEEAFIAHPTENCVFKKETEVFSKAEWEIALEPGNYVIGVHIPKNTDFSPENIDAAFEGARDITMKGFGEVDPKMFMCGSWLLSPDLDEMLKPDSKILGFARRFARFPRKGTGKSVFNFVFPQSFKGPYEDLPEDTSLMRALKAKYIAGGYVLDYGGVIAL